MFPTPLAILKDATTQLGSWHKGKARREQAVVRGLYSDKTERGREQPRKTRL